MSSIESESGGLKPLRVVILMSVLFAAKVFAGTEATEETESETTEAAAGFFFTGGGTAGDSSSGADLTLTLLRGVASADGVSTLAITPFLAFITFIAFAAFIAAFMGLSVLVAVTLLILGLMSMPYFFVKESRCS